MPVAKPESKRRSKATRQKVDASPSKKLEEECCGCRLRLSRFSTSKGFDETTKEEISAAIGVDKKAISGGKRLFDPKHPLIKKANDVLSRISNYWVAMTLPLAQTGTAEAKLEGGIRLVRRDQIQEFHDRMVAYLSELETVQQEMNDNREDILDASREILRDKFNVDDFPKEFVLTVTWGFPSVEVPSYLASLAPEIYAQERESVRQRFEHSFQLSINQALREFQAVVGSWVDRLGPVHRIYPPGGTKFSHMRGGEIEQVEEHKHNPDVPEGHRRLRIAYKKTGQSKTTKEWIGPLSAAQYADLRSEPDSKRHKRFHNSTIDNLLETVAKFRRLGDTMSASEEFKKIVDDVGAQIGRFNDSDELAKELRNSSTFREDTQALMRRMASKLEAEVETVQRKRRKVIRPD
jgi:hypothetical protein